MADLNGLSPATPKRPEMSTQSLFRAVKLVAGFVRQRAVHRRPGDRLTERGAEGTILAERHDESREANGLQVHEYIGHLHSCLDRIHLQRLSSPGPYTPPSRCLLHANPCCSRMRLVFARAWRPACPDFVPSEQTHPKRALDGIVVRPNGFHFGQVERFEGHIEALVRCTNSFFDGFLLRCGLGRHIAEPELELYMSEPEIRMALYLRLYP